jgi:hypothetical protein
MNAPANKENVIRKLQHNGITGVSVDTSIDRVILGQILVQFGDWGIRIPLIGLNLEPQSLQLLSRTAVSFRA